MPTLSPTRGLRAFCICAKCLSFKHAAEKLCLTPSAVSHQIKQLEQQLGCQLFERKTRAIALTAQGKAFYQQVSPLMQQLEHVLTEFSLQHHQHNIVITVPEFFASEMLMPKLAEFTKLQPQINLQLATAKPYQTVADNVDISIQLASTAPVDGIVEPLFPVHYVAACSPSLYQQLKNQGYQALNQVPLLLHQARPWAWHQWADQLHIDDFSPKQVIQFDNMYAVARGAEQGMGIALVPLPLSKAWFSERLLVRLFDDELHTKDQYYLVQHQYDVPTKEVNILKNWLIAQFTQKNFEY